MVSGDNLADETVSLTGVSFSASIGSVDIVSTNIIIPTGISFTGSVGSISPVIPKTVELGSLSFQSTVDSLTTTADANVSLTGQAITGANGVITPADQVMGLTGQSSTVQQGTAVAPNEDVTLTWSSNNFISRGQQLDLVVVLYFQQGFLLHQHREQRLHQTTHKHYLVKRLHLVLEHLLG